MVPFLRVGQVQETRQLISRLAYSLGQLTGKGAQGIIYERSGNFIGMLVWALAWNMSHKKVSVVLPGNITLLTVIFSP